MKRFYKDASLARADDGWAIQLDGRPVRTPARAVLAVPGEALGQAIAAEWAAQGDTIDPATMPLTGLANASIDRILPALGDFRGQIAAYAASDLLAYRATDPAPLVARQAAHWDPLLDWARARHGVSFTITSGIMPVDQPAVTLVRLRGAVEALDPWLLAGAAIITQIGGTLVGTLAFLDGHMSAEALFDLTVLDERWQAERWGEDAEASAHLARRRAELLNAARYCTLVATPASG